MGYVPVIDAKVISLLAEQFPDQAPSMDLTEKEVWFRAGQVSVVRWLKKRLDDQQQSPFGVEVP